jgi:large conductance mechanosensitive channel
MPRASAIGSTAEQAGGLLREFKAFVTRGNVLDLAVAVVIGAAFGLIVTSFVNDVLMPPIGLLLGHVDFKDLFVSLNGQSYPTLAAAKAAAAPVIAYGQFLNTIINFLIIAFAVFLVVRAASRFQRAPEPAPPARECRYCGMAIPVQAVRCPHCTSQLAGA